MNSFQNRVLLCTGLLLYGLALTAALLYFRFPTEEFKHFCQTQAERLLPGAHCSVGQLNYRFPLSIHAQQIAFSSRQGKKEILCNVDQVLLTPQLSSLKSHFKLAVTAWNGEHSFALLLNQEKQQFSMEDIQLHNLDLARVPFLQQSFGREITGSLSGSGSYHGSWNTTSGAAEGQGALTIEKGGFGLLLPIFSLHTIDLKKLTTDLVLQKNSLQFNKGTFHGQELKGEFSGNLALQAPFNHSEFSFKGELEPLPPLLKKSKYAQNMVIQLKKQRASATLPFLLQGSVENPKFKFDS